MNHFELKDNRRKSSKILEQIRKNEARISQAEELAEKLDSFYCDFADHRTEAKELSEKAKKYRKKFERDAELYYRKNQVLLTDYKKAIETENSKVKKLSAA